MILVFWLDCDLMVFWVKKKIMVLENWQDSMLKNDSKVMWEKFESKRNRYWHGWCIANLYDFGVLA